MKEKVINAFLTLFAHDEKRWIEAHVCEPPMISRVNLPNSQNLSKKLNFWRHSSFPNQVETLKIILRGIVNQPLKVGFTSI